MLLLHITDHAEGCIVPVRAQPGARRNTVVGAQAGAVKIAVTAPADQGKANKAIGEVLADILAVKRSQVDLCSGPTSRDKKFLVRGLSGAEAQNRLAPFLAK